MNMRVRMLGGTQVGYARMTRRWWTPVHERLAEQGLTDRPLYFVSSNTHSLVNIATGVAREREEALVEFVESAARGRHPARPSSRRSARAAARAPGRTSSTSWRALYFDSHGEEGRAARRRSEAGVRRVAHPEHDGAARARADHPAGAAGAGAARPAAGRRGRRRARGAPRRVIVNIDYPLGVAAYNILREVAVDSSTLRGVYVLGKAATLNADVGDVMLSSVVHDEHSGSTYWLDNAFSVDDLAPATCASAAGSTTSARSPSRARSCRTAPTSTSTTARRSRWWRWRPARTATRSTRSPTPTATPWRGGQLLEAAARLRDHPLRLRHALHAGAHARRPRPELLRDGLDLRVVAGDPAADPAAGGRARLAPASAAGWRTCATGRPLGADGVPGRLQLGESLEAAERVGRRAGVVGRRGVCRTRVTDLGGQLVDLGGELRVARRVDDRVQRVVARRAPGRARRGGRTAGSRRRRARRRCPHLAEIEARRAALRRRARRRRCSPRPAPAPARPPGRAAAARRAPRSPPRRSARAPRTTGTARPPG